MEGFRVNQDKVIERPAHSFNLDCLFEVGPEPGGSKNNNMRAFVVQHCLSINKVNGIMNQDIYKT